MESREVNFTLVQIPLPLIQQISSSMYIHGKMFDCICIYWFEIWTWFEFTSGVMCMWAQWITNQHEIFISIHINMIKSDCMGIYAKPCKWWLYILEMRLPCKDNEVSCWFEISNHFELTLVLCKRTLRVRSKVGSLSFFR